MFIMCLKNLYIEQREKLKGTVELTEIKTLLKIKRIKHQRQSLMF